MNEAPEMLSHGDRRSESNGRRNLLHGVLRGLQQNPGAPDPRVQNPLKRAGAGLLLKVPI